MRPIGGELVTTITSPSCWGTHFLYLSNPPAGIPVPIIPCPAYCPGYRRLPGCAISYRDSAPQHTRQWMVDGGIKAGIYCTLKEKKLLHAIMLALEF